MKRILGYACMMWSGAAIPPRLWQPGMWWQLGLALVFCMIGIRLVERSFK